MSKYVIFTIIFLCGISTIKAETTTYDIEKCITTALTNNYDLQLSEAQIVSAKANLRSVFGQYLPSINAGMSYNRDLQLTEMVKLPESWGLSGSASLTLFDGFAREAEYKQAESHLRNTDNSLNYVYQTVIYQVLMNYINVVRNAQVMKITDANITAAKARLANSQARFEAGVGTISIVYSQEAEIGNLESQLINAENDFEKSKAALLTIMGLSPTLEAQFLESALPNEIEKSVIDQFKKEVGSFNTCVSIAMENRNDMKSAKESILGSEAGIKASKAGYSPQLGANISLSSSSNTLADFGSSPNGYFGLSLSIPVFTNFRVNNAIQNAKLNLKQNEIELLKLEQTIKQDLQNAFSNLTSAEKQIEVTARSIRSARQNFEAVQESFNQGMATTTDLATANSQLLTTEINRINAVYGYVAAQKQVLYAMGILK